MSKKSIGALEVVIGFVILIVVAIVVIFIFKTYVGREVAVIGEKLDSLGDCDCDGVPNFLDKCPCIPGLEGAELTGCLGDRPVPCTSAQIKQCKENPKALCQPKP